MNGTLTKNFSEETLRACYELEHGLGEEMTLEEFNAELDEICNYN